MNTVLQYTELIKPAWAPPSWVFSPVWTVLYAIIIVSFGAVFYRAWCGLLPRMVALPFALNVVFNLAFTPLQFGLQSNLLASVDIVLVWATLLWAGAAIWRHMRWVVYVNVPYFLWVSFATALQLTITYLNI